MNVKLLKYIIIIEEKTSGKCREIIERLFYLLFNLMNGTTIDHPMMTGCRCHSETEEVTTQGIRQDERRGGR